MSKNNDTIFNNTLVQDNLSKNSIRATKYGFGGRDHPSPGSSAFSAVKCLVFYRGAQSCAEKMICRAKQNGALGQYFRVFPHPKKKLQIK